MSNASKSKGTLFETAIVRCLEENGIHAARIPLAGNQDRGDVLIRDATVVVESKSCKKMELAAWVGEADLEASRWWPPHEGVVWHKRTGRTSPLDAYVTMSGHTFVDLLRRLLPA